VTSSSANDYVQNPASDLRFLKVKTAGCRTNISRIVLRLRSFLIDSLQHFTDPSCLGVKGPEGIEALDPEVPRYWIL
jgi:hypothetical protein